MITWNINIIKDPISKKNKIKILYFNLNNSVSLISFWNSVNRYSNIISSEFKINKKTFLNINKKYRLNSFFNFILNNKIWVLLDLLIQTSNIQQLISKLKFNLEKLLNDSIKIILIDKTILNYLNTNNFVNLKQTFSNKLQILPFSTQLDNFTRNYLSLINSNKFQLKNSFLKSKKINNNFLNSEIFSSQKILLFFNKNIKLKDLIRLIQEFEISFKIKNFSFFFNGKSLTNISYKLQIKNFKIDNTLMNLFFKSSNLDFYINDTSILFNEQKNLLKKNPIFFNFKLISLYFFIFNLKLINLKLKNIFISLKFLKILNF